MNTGTMVSVALLATMLASPAFAFDKLPAPAKPMPAADWA